MVSEDTPQPTTIPAPAPIPEPEPEHQCRENELQQSLEAVRLEMQMLKERVRLLAAENDGYQKAMIDKNMELEDRDTTVLELKQDVEVEREKVKIMEEDKERESFGLLDCDAAFPAQLMDAAGSATGSSSPHRSESALSQTSELDQDPDVPEQDLEPDDLPVIRNALDGQAKELAGLASMDESNSTMPQRFAKFNEVRSQLMVLVDQANLEGVRLHRELDRSITSTLVRVFSLLLILTSALLLKYLHDYLYARLPAQPCVF